jgi:SAM-dependent methyltransferase
MPSISDYRTSHLQRGADYDRNLSSGNFDSYMADREREILSELVPRLYPRGIPRYLDFACGTGRITQILEPMAVRSFGVDVSQEMLQQAREKCPRSTFLLRDLTREEPPSEPFDLISAFRFFGNAQDELRRSALRAMNRMLGDGGHLLLNNHRNPRAIRNLLLRARGIDPGMDLSHAKLTRLLEEAGFRVVWTRGVGLWVVRDRDQRPEILASRTARRLEGVSRVRPLRAFCPDLVMLAQKVGPPC